MNRIPVLVVAAAIAAIGSVPFSFADNPEDVAIPAECNPFTDGIEFVHTLSATRFPVPVDPDEPLFPGDTAIAIANFNNPLNDQFQTEDIEQVRFLWYDGTGALQQETVVPVDTDATTIADDMFVGVYGPGTTWEVVACYENSDSTVGGDTIHVDVDSFFVLPESPLGAVALVAMSLGSLGAFMILKSRRSD